jgi:hypothetical protein
MIAMLERTIQKKLIKHFEELGFVAVKIKNTNNTGFPDLLILGENGYAHFIEVKRPGNELSPKQRYWYRKLQKLGHKVEARIKV